MTDVSRLARFRKPIVLAAAAVGIGAIGVSVARVPGAAEDASQQLEAAAEALKAGDQAAARTAVEEARDDIDVAQAGLQGPAGLVGQWIPGIGSSVRDARHLGNALDAATSVAEIGVDVLPEVTGEDSTFFTDGQVDIVTLRGVVEGAADAHAELTQAREELDAIIATGPGAGRLAQARDQAMEQVQPLQEGLGSAMPLLRQLPEILGANGERKYLVAILNPAELRYSGGTPLTYTPVTVRNGEITFEEAVDTATNARMFEPRFWRKVKGNPFHRGQMRMFNATIPPSWPVAGEEALNAWRSIRGRNMAGLVVADVVTLSRLVGVTGPMDVPGYGRVDGDNLVHTLVGNYQESDDNARRKQANRALVTTFIDRLFQPEAILEKGEALAESARGRHFAAYFREPETQGAITRLGMSGDLSTTEHDYLGVFTQNVVPSKSDYWQSRSLRSTVQLRANGRARVSLEVEIHNDSPPYTATLPDPGLGYFTRWATSSIGTFLPRGAEVDVVELDGKPLDFVQGDYFGRPFVRETVEFAPQASRVLRLEYDVPKAAQVGADGLTYRLDIDPQGLVRPQSVSARVHLPRGFEFGEHAEEWVTSGPRTATWSSDAVDESPSLSLGARRTAASP